MAEIVQGQDKILKIKWKLHTAYKPQSSGKVEHMNQTIKTSLAKLCQETRSPWIDMLPLALLRACCATRPSGYSLFQSLYGRPLPIVNRLRGDLRQIGNHVPTSPSPRKNPTPHLLESLRKDHNPHG
jgi:hypothetical protein